MDADYTIYVVDGDSTTRLILESMLAARYTVETFECAEDCLARVADAPPNLFIVDVELPGMDGFAFCQEIKGKPALAEIPVVFLSARDNPADVLAGYEAGGQEYIVKPFDVVNLYHNIENLRRIEQERQALSSQAKASDELTTLILANLDEYAALIKFLRTLNECESPDEVVLAVLRLLDMYHLDGAVQMRMRDGEKTISHAGENWPLEIAVINHVRMLERIFEFKKRAAYNFDRVTILVHNMPVADAELCGRIRDDLAIAAESADAKLAALQSFADNQDMRARIHDVLERVGQTVETFARRYDEARYRGSVHTEVFLDDMLAAFAHLGMTSQQEEEILDMVKTRSEELVNLYDIGGATQATLAELIAALEEILKVTADKRPARAARSEEREAATESPALFV